MKINKVSFIVLFLLPVSALAAKSFLVPQKFPETAADLSFSEKAALKIEDYAAYSDLSPYHYLNLVETEADMQDEIEEDEKTDGETQAPVVNASPGFCANRNPNIPFGQKIPFGNPTMAPTKICSKYGWRPMQKGDGTTVNDPHYGIDIGCKAIYFDTPIYAAADGVVIKTQPARKCDSAGNYIKIQHDSGFITMYMHLNSIGVKPGQRVYAGCPIGTMGYTGGAKALKTECRGMGKDISHLHYQIGYTGTQRSVTAPNGKVINLNGLNGKSLKYSVNPTEFFLYQ